RSWKRGWRGRCRSKPGSWPHRRVTPADVERRDLMIAPKSHPPGWRNTLSAIAPPALLMAFIFWIGTDRGSATETRSFLESLLQSWWPSLAERLGLEGFRLINVIVRKLGHFLGYGLLGLLNA